MHAQCHAAVCVCAVVYVLNKKDRHYQSCFVAMVTIEVSNNAGTLKQDNICLVPEKHHFQIKTKKKKMI